MNYRKIFTAAFAEAAPRRSEETAAREIIEKGKAMKTAKTSTRKICTSIAAAAAVLIIGGVSVGAATGWSFTGAFDKLFADRAEDDSYVSPIDFSKMGKELDEKFEGEGYTLNVRGVAASERSLFLLCDVTFTEEFLAGNSIDKDDKVDVYGFISSGDDGSGTSQMYMNEGSTYSFYMLFHNDSKEYSDTTVNVDFSRIKIGETYIECDHEFKLDIDFDVMDDVAVKYTNIEVQAGEDTVILNKVTYDAFSVQLRFYYDYLPEALGELHDTFSGGSYITKTDGTQVALTDFGGSCAKISSVQG